MLAMARREGQPDREEFSMPGREILASILVAYEGWSW